VGSPGNLFVTSAGDHLPRHERTHVHLSSSQKVKPRSGRLESSIVRTILGGSPAPDGSPASDAPRTI
jgi:hypothetical protein